MKVFKFSDDDVKSKIIYDLKLMKRIGKSFDYVHEKLKELGHHVSGDTPLTKDICSEGKSYRWVAITNGNVKILIRIYNLHFTIYTCLEEKMDKWSVKRYGSFTYMVDTKKITEDDEIEGIPTPSEGEQYIADYYSDYMYDQPFLMLNSQMKTLIEIIRKQEVHTLWNNYSFERPHFITVKNIYDNNNISSIDDIVFCAEELSNKHIELFAQTDMLEGIKRFKVGDEFKGDMHKGTITEIRTELKNNYYHGVGLKIGDKWEDVYSLTRWDLEGVFPEE